MAKCASTLASLWWKTERRKKGNYKTDMNIIAKSTTLSNKRIIKETFSSHTHVRSNGLA